MQDPTRQDEHEGTVPRLLEAVRTTIRATPYCFLITLDPTGVPRARLMGHLEPERDMTVWMVSPPQARKVLDLQREHRATLAYYDMAGRGYVTLTGQTRLVSDPQLRGGRWKERWSHWFPGGAQGNDSLLIALTPDQIELMSFALEVATEPFTFQPVVLERRGSTWVRTDGQAGQEDKHL